jgi:uncharacterized protein YgiM (DUF1202 family)
MAKTNRKRMVGVVLPTRLNVRQSPLGKIVGLLNCGDSVEVISTKDNWAKIRYGSDLMWVAAEHIEVKGEVEDVC